MFSFWMRVGMILGGRFASHHMPQGLGAEFRRMARQMINKYDEYASRKTGKPIKKRSWRN